MKVISLKIGLDRHVRCFTSICKALVKARIEVVYLGLCHTADMIVATTVLEGAKNIGISILSKSHMEADEKLIRSIKQRVVTDIKVVFGVTIPAENLAKLEKIEVSKVFQVETKLEYIIVCFTGKVVIPATKTSETTNEFKTDYNIPVKDYYTTEDQGYKLEILWGTIKNDITKEFLSRNTHIFSIEESLKIVADIITYALEKVLHFNPISCSGNHIRELSSAMLQELGFTLATGITYIDSIIERRISVYQFGNQLSFQLSCNLDIYEKVAKCRADRRVWANIIKELFKPKNEKSMLLRVFPRCKSLSFTLREPINNIIWGVFNCLTGFLEGTRAINVQAHDEAFAIHKMESVLIILRTQQITTFETGMTNTVDSLLEPYYMENLTNSLENMTFALIEELSNGENILPLQEEYFIKKQRDSMRLLFSREDHEHIGVA